MIAVFVSVILAAPPTTSAAADPVAELAAALAGGEASARRRAAVRARRLDALQQQALRRQAEALAGAWRGELIEWARSADTVQTKIEELHQDWEQRATSLRATIDKPTAAPLNDLDRQLADVRDRYRRLTEAAETLAGGIERMRDRCERLNDAAKLIAAVGGPSLPRDWRITSSRFRKATGLRPDRRAVGIAERVASAHRAWTRRRAEQLADQRLAGPEREVLVAVNELRVVLGRRPLAIDATLLKAARHHSRWMATHGMRHIEDGAGMTNCWDRARHFGYPVVKAIGQCLVGENLSAGPPVAAAIVRSWWVSPPHRMNMVLPIWSDLAVGMHAGSGEGPASTTRWTLLVGNKTLPDNYDQYAGLKVGTE